MLKFQEVLSRLTAYWAEQGAMTVQPFNTEVGAGTANPATALRVLGPEPWRVAYVEPSVRPDDSRYGENPNRLQTHTQFQVILKPDPGNPQELYLESLAAIGIDLDAHDVRFVEDNWASPALGAWGLGWEVWLDGMEITQFTYFQQMGGVTLSPTSVEITYGLERIVMALQGVNHFKDIQYAPGITYGEAFGQVEYEMSRYYLDDADIDTARRLYDLHEAEATLMIERRLPVPAYYNLLKCSHTFNVLDARGVVSTAERARAFSTMRRLSRDVASLWVERREENGFPLGTVQTPVAAEPLPLPAPATAPSTLLFEIGLEELPAGEVERAQDWLGTTVRERLSATRLTFGAVRALATPRRLVVLVDDVAVRESDATETVRGPRATAAFDAAGALTRAATGFAGKHGVDPATLERVQVDGVEYVSVVRQLPGRAAAQVLSSLLADVVRDLHAERNMRWSDPDLAYVRPIRWLLALLGEAPLPVTAGALTSGTSTRVLRLASTPTVEVTSAHGYEDFLRGHDIMLDRSQRRRVILEAAHRLAAAAGGRVDEDVDGGVVDEIVDLVEWPVPVRGSFDERYLELPPEILIAVMRKHQRYLPIRQQDGAGLLAGFVTFANGSCDLDVVANGNAAVVRARFEDASFFWAADRRRSLADLHAGLEKLTFETSLGSMAQRSARIARIASAVATRTGLSATDSATVERAGALAKFDLASQMVVEMTSLAGTMARYYALAAGESEAVATALSDMERPRSSEDSPASTLPGAVLALADRADLLAGLFAIGASPSGSKDPFGLRRAALGLVATLHAHPELAGLSVPDLLETAAQALRAQGLEVPGKALEQAATFVVRRQERAYVEAGHDVDLVTAVLPLAATPAATSAVLAEVEKLVAAGLIGGFVEGVQRARRLIGNADRPAAGSPLDVSADPSSQSLAEVYGQARTAGYAPGASLTQLVEACAPLVTALHAFLEDVQVMAPDPAVRQARIAILSAISDVAETTGLDWEALSRAVKIDAQSTTR
ncbi:glycine--tRNA ligase [Kineosporia sp. NBRC 101731]|uniref:glycine--tRNA ligase n=1 Tax=Kineosporia sp. NBRC 101731 TaxID=3032199 RepID=UPI0024A2F868|nr:glycine--tRNA ligase [Kineosporia sp. NBRC 101731]GLY33830.1 glycine--tRNA ligase [Kineosporia sp. NBRC 101731]